MFVCLQSDHIFPCGKKKKRMLVHRCHFNSVISWALKLVFLVWAVGRSSCRRRKTSLQLVPSHSSTWPWEGSLSLMPVLQGPSSTNHSIYSDSDLPFQPGRWSPLPWEYLTSIEHTYTKEIVVSTLMSRSNFHVLFLTVKMNLMGKIPEQEEGVEENPGLNICL